MIRTDLLVGILKIMTRTELLVDFLKFMTRTELLVGILKGGRALRGYFGPPMRPKNENYFSQVSSY